MMQVINQEEPDMNTPSHASAHAKAIVQRPGSRVVAMLLCLLGLLLPGCASVGAPEEFESPEGAVQELARALRMNDTQRLHDIFGPEGEDLLVSGDPVADEAGYETFLSYYEEKHSLEAVAENRRILVIGTNDWPVPVPIVLAGARWHFEAAAGREEILDRRIGWNELASIQVCQAIADAQREYAMLDADGNGSSDYAQQFLSDSGRRNGLYWPSVEGEAQSPLGELVVAATSEGYEAREEGPTPYHGYYYRILRAQGPAAPGGALNYVVKDKMLLGFAVVAYPSEYGNSGIMTFIVAADGVVHERDLGEDTEKLGADMEAYDPGQGWERAE